MILRWRIYHNNYEDYMRRVFACAAPCERDLSDMLQRFLIVDGVHLFFFYSCAGDLSHFRELDRWNHFWEKLESSKSALGDLWQKVTHEMRWAPYTGHKIMTMVIMRAMMWAFTSIWCGDVKDDGDDGDDEDDGKAEAPSPGRPLPWKGSLADIPTTLNMNHLCDALHRINSAACCYFQVSSIHSSLVWTYISINDYRLLKENL